MRILTLALVAATLVSLRAEAAVITTLSFTGTTYSIYDGAGAFGAPNTGYGSNLGITGTFAYDPTAFNACSNSQSCIYTITAANKAVETIFFNGKSASFAVTGGSFMLNSGGGNAEQIIINANGPFSTGISLTMQDTNKLFSTPTNPALGFGNVAQTSGSDSTGRNGESIGFAVTSVSAATVNVPEPVTLGLFGIGLLGLASIRRARRS